MKCRGKADTTVHELFRVVSRIPHYISCYITESRLPLGQCRVTSDITTQPYDLC